MRVRIRGRRKEQARSDPARGVPHIVVIDDDPDLRSLLADSLHAFGGYQVTAGADGAPGLDQVMARHPT